MHFLGVYRDPGDTALAFSVLQPKLNEYNVMIISRVLRILGIYFEISFQRVF